jgi:hypothetical protein
MYYSASRETWLGSNCRGVAVNINNGDSRYVHFRRDPAEKLGERAPKQVSRTWIYGQLLKVPLGRCAARPNPTHS